MTAVTSAMDPAGTGTRIATPSNRPARPGSAFVVARAAPVEAGQHVRRPGPADRCFFRSSSRRNAPVHFQHQVHAECLPGQAGGVPHGEHRNLPAADDKGITVCGDGRVPAAIDSVVPQQVGQVVGGDQVVDRDHLGAGGLLEDLDRRASDAAQAVDRDAGHGASPSISCAPRFPCSWSRRKPAASLQRDRAGAARSETRGPEPERSAAAGFRRGRGAAHRVPQEQVGPGAVPTASSSAGGSSSSAATSPGRECLRSRPAPGRRSGKLIQPPVGGELAEQPRPALGEHHAAAAGADRGEHRRRPRRVRGVLRDLLRSRVAVGSRHRLDNQRRRVPGRVRHDGGFVRGRLDRDRRHRPGQAVIAASRACAG